MLCNCGEVVRFGEGSKVILFPERAYTMVVDEEDKYVAAAPHFPPAGGNSSPSFATPARFRADLGVARAPAVRNRSYGEHTATHVL